MFVPSLIRRRCSSRFWPEQVLRLPEGLARVDAVSDDPALFSPFVPFALGTRDIGAADDEVSALGPGNPDAEPRGRYPEQSRTPGRA